MMTQTGRRSLHATPAPRTTVDPGLITEMLDRLDDMDDASKRNRRSSPRGVYRRLDVDVQINHPGGSSSQRTVATRNLSATGMAFLHNSFLYNQTLVRVTLPRRVGPSDVVEGRVVHCRHIAGIYHQIGLSFDEKIFPKLYLDPASYDNLEIEVPVDLSKLAGSVVYLDEQMLDRELMKHQVRGTRVELQTVATLTELAASLKPRPADLILFDFSASPESSPQMVINTARGAGFTGPCCVVTAETSRAKLKAATAAGAVGILVKPFDSQKLGSLLQQWLPSSRPGHEIRSTLADNEELRPLLDKYIRTVHQYVADIQNAADAQDFARLRTLCMSIKGSGTGFGYPRLTDTARETLRSLDATSNVADALVQVQQLIDTCRRIC